MGDADVLHTVRVLLDHRLPQTGNLRTEGLLTCRLLVSASLGLLIWHGNGMY